MLRHIVLMQTRPGTSWGDLSALADRIRDLADTVSGPNSCVVGSNVTEEPLSQGFDFGFVMTFASRLALDAYHVNPAHLGISLAIRDLSNAVLVFDLEN
jgi:hypothetical protein